MYITAGYNLFVKFIIVETEGCMCISFLKFIHSKVFIAVQVLLELLLSIAIYYYGGTRRGRRK